MAAFCLLSLMRRDEWDSPILKNGRMVYQSEHTPDLTLVCALVCRVCREISHIGIIRTSSSKIHTWMEKSAIWTRSQYSTGTWGRPPLLDLQTIFRRPALTWGRCSQCLCVEHLNPSCPVLSLLTCTNFVSASPGVEAWCWQAPRHLAWRFQGSPGQPRDGSGDLNHTVQHWLRWCWLRLESQPAGDPLTWVMAHQRKEGEREGGGGGGGGVEICLKRVVYSLSFLDLLCWPHCRKSHWRTRMASFWPRRLLRSQKLLALLCKTGSFLRHQQAIFLVLICWISLENQHGPSLCSRIFTFARTCKTLVRQVSSTTALLNLDTPPPPPPPGLPLPIPPQCLVSHSAQ